MTRYTEQFGVQKNIRGASLINIILISVITLLVAASAFFYTSTMRRDAFDKSFQVVVLDTGEVFVGKVIKERSSRLELVNIYYLPITAEDLFSQEFNAIHESISVIKIGNELHGPEDSMVISQEHIVYIQNLKENSKIVTAIEEYQQ